MLFSLISVPPPNSSQGQECSLLDITSQATRLFTLGIYRLLRKLSQVLPAGHII
ncbi:hypothetical protein M6B38_209480 [Iris pallida]|uniref:Uncharacterized protein n=1 Tax=Iris pallida TaxID=29817 RepID=A0AAX6DQC8_IRIPA|nr:hypothetical protein M6B38_232920 [Iris pallida]KAJ6795139.1 hypothetical protein M6B38_227270 [Iris pallida]KAJ6799105.1 hypothetical protein M6B38_209480 [Iris pallida]